MDLSLTDRVALVTGGASNIGRATSAEFARDGARVAIFDRRRHGRTHGRRDPRRRRHRGDLRGRPHRRRGDDAGIDAVGRDLGPIAVLVNNVGSIGKATFFLDLEPERWEQAFWLNLFPTFNATHAVLPKMVERRDGAIVSIASDATFGEPRMSDYGPMKAGVLAFSRIIAKEFGRFGIRANSICPGLVLPEPDAIGEHILRAGDVGFGEREVDNITSSIPLRRRPEATDLAAAVAMLAPERARMLTGQLLSVSGGFAMPR